MVISDKHKYVFIEMIRTGSTAISAELCELYSGRKILNKHSYYHEFLKVANEEQKKYLVFVGCRNPLDMVVSGYIKYKSDHLGRYSDPKHWRRNGGTITDKNLSIYNDIRKNNLSFKQYLKKYYRLPYSNTSIINNLDADFVIRFEHIWEDFEKVLSFLKITPARKLPVKNKTADKDDFLNYYTKDIQSYALFIFGPIMKKFGYEFPADWPKKRFAFVSDFIFELYTIGKKMYWRRTKSNSMPD
jgi:sulfotransferase famil protein